MTKLTKTQIDALTPDSKKKTLWDDNPKGLGVRVGKKGAKTFVLKYWNQYGQQRKFTIGKFGVLALEQARKRAREYLADIAFYHRIPRSR